MIPREEGTDGWGKLHNGGLCNLYHVPHILRVRNWRGYRWNNIVKISVEETGSNSVRWVLVDVVRIRRIRYRNFEFH